MKSKITDEQRRNLEIFIAGVAALNSGEGRSQASHQITAVLADDLLAFRKVSGLAEAWQEERFAAYEERLPAELRAESAHLPLAERMKPSFWAGKLDAFRVKKGRELWAKIHSRALAFIPGNEAAEVSFLTRELPRSLPPACSCRPDYKKFLETTPPDFTSADAYFAWTVNLHNHVNTRLEKPVLSLDEALSIWKRE